MKKTLTTIAFLTGAMFFSTALIAQQDYGSKTAPDAKPAVANDKDLGNKTAVPIFKPIPPLASVALSVDKTLPQDANKTTVTPTPGNQPALETNQHNLPRQGVAKTDYPEPPAATVPAPKLSTVVVTETPKPPVRVQSVIQPLPVKNN